MTDGDDKARTYAPSNARAHRIETRQACTVVLRVTGHYVDGGTFVETGVTADISASGAAIMLKHPVYVGDRVRVEEVDGPLRGRAVVRNVLRLDGEWRVGLEFIP
jgi:hypothetical protein